MFNPVNSKSFDGTSANTTPSNPINDPGVSNHQGSNTFDLSAQNALTARYGEIMPFFYSVGVPGDRFSLQSSHELRTYTLGAPLLSTLRMHKQNFSVPLSAIMPNTWDLIYKNPVKGNDIPDDALCSFSLAFYQSAFVDIFKSQLAYMSKQTVATVKAQSAFGFLPWLMLYYSSFSCGSLLHCLGITSNAEYNGASSPLTVTDKRFDVAFSALMQAIQNIDVNTVLVTVPLTSDYSLSVYPTRSSVRQFLAYALDYPDVYNGVAQAMTINASFGAALVTFYTALATPVSKLTILAESINSVNLYKVIAYQMICAQYFTNDHVDNIYNAKLWLQNMQSIAYSSVGLTMSNCFFTYNGSKIQYDVFSNRLLALLIGKFAEGDTSALFFFCNLFTFRRSLKYGDYFNSSRTQPLAVGDVTAPVVGSKVSAIDTTKSISYQRFLNAVNRAGSYIKDYVKSIFGVSPEQIEPMPNFLSRETFIVGKDEVDNTSDNQGAIVTNLVDQDSRFMFDVFIDTPSVILGLLTFDCVGCYQTVTEKDNFHLDRYDMFNPFLQNIGDQSVLLTELHPYSDGSKNFGYQVRNAEYKFKVNQCHGGFVYNLPSWLFTFDDDSVTSISSESIRSKPSDLDAFYNSLTYGSTAGYFHFIVSCVNEVHANRRMQFEPNIL